MQKNKKLYSTTDDGINYREIAEVMTRLGEPMNHSSARNYVIKVMLKCVSAYAKSNNLSLTDKQKFEIAKSHLFQDSVAEILYNVIAKRKQNNDLHRNQKQT